MSRYGPDSAEVLVFTFKEGLLAAVAHDLQLRVTGFEIDADEDARTVRARFDPSSLRVVCAMRRGSEAPDLLGREDKAEIERNIAEQVLHAYRYGSITFESTSITDAEVKGRLTLHGTTHPIVFSWSRRGDFRVAEVRLDQRDYGVVPYRALGGTLRVGPEVVIRVRLPVAPLPPPGTSPEPSR